MKKNNFLSKFVSILIILFIIVQLISPIVFAKDWTSSKYLALGDSIAYGYGLANRDTRMLFSNCKKQIKNLSK